MTGHSFILDVTETDVARRGLEEETRQYDTLGTMLAKTVMDWEKYQTVIKHEYNISPNAADAYSSYLSAVDEYYSEDGQIPATAQSRTEYYYTFEAMHYYGSGLALYAQVSDWSHLTRIDEYDHSELERSTQYEYAPNGRGRELCRADLHGPGDH